MPRTWVVVLGECRILSRLFRVSRTMNQERPRWWSRRCATLKSVRRACTFLGVSTKASSTGGMPALPAVEMRLASSALPATDASPRQGSMPPLQTGDASGAGKSHPCSRRRGPTRCDLRLGAGSLALGGLRRGQREPTEAGQEGVPGLHHVQHATGLREGGVRLPTTAHCSFSTHTPEGNGLGSGSGPAACVDEP